MDAVESDFTQILKLNHALFAEDIEHVAFTSNHKSQIAALVLSNSDIVLWKAASNDGNPTMKWIPWKTDPDSKVKAIAFQPASMESVSEDKTELLIITHDGNMYIINMNKIINDDIAPKNFTKMFLYASCPISNFIPTAIVWWDSTHYRHKDIAIIGGNNGQIVFYSLTHACYITVMSTGSKSPIFSLSICCDFFRDYSYLLITNDLRQQWKLLLEKEVNGGPVVLAFEENEVPSTSKPEKSIKASPQAQQKSRLQEFKQMSVETFALLKQKLNESRRPNIDRPRMGSISIEHSEIQSCDCYGEAFLSVQQYKNRRVLTGLFIPESVLLLYLQSKDSMTLIHHKFKISPLVTTLLLTNAFVYVADIMETQHRILIFSTRLSESKKMEPIEYNPASFVQSFLFPEEERIISLFKMEKKLQSNEAFDSTVFGPTSDSPHLRPAVKQIRLEEEWNEACLVVTNKGIYIISLRNNPVEIAMESIKFDIGMVKKLTLIFNLSLSKVIEHLTDRLIEEKKVDDALSLCSTSKCYSGKMTLKLASIGRIEELLMYTENLLNLMDLDLPLVERIHLSNFVVTCYAEQYLRDSLNGTLYRRFMNFLKSNYHYDEEVNIHILANYKLFSFVHFLTVWRGLYFDGCMALTNSLAQSQNDKFKNVHHFDGFWQLFSEPTLSDAFVLNPRTLHLHIQFLRQHINEIPNHILKRLYEFYDPTRPVVKPAVCRMLKTPIEEYLEAYDFQNDKWGYDANMYDWITNFLYLHIYMFKYQNFDYALNKYVSGVLHTTISQKCPSETAELEKFPSSSVLSAGFAHAAVVRNGSLVTWGQAAYGCLGNGPTLSQNCAPVLSTWFEDHRIQVKYVSCGRHHTVVLTENGVYSWGSNKFGQLGVGRVGQSVYPRMVEALASYCIVFINAGQYHSCAIDASGRLWTWGWGVYGQLGHGNTEDQFYPKLVEKLKKKIIVNANGGQAHSIVLTNKGKVFTFGCNTFGQLGIGTTVKSTTPVKVFGVQEKIINIATSYFHNLVLSESNRLFTWGSSPQILKLQAQSQKRARSMQNFQDRNECADSSGNSGDGGSAVVENSSFEHPTAPVDNGRHLSPTLVDTTLVQEKILQISCGLFHSALLTSNNQIYTWGRNVDGQLGNCKRQIEVSLPTPVNIFSIKLLSTNKQHMDYLNRPLWKISCGKDYTLAMELENRLFGWGNNSCGQLGTLPQEDFSIKRYLNGKFIVNKYAKRMIKVSHGGINIIEKPMEIQSLPKVQLMFNDENIIQSSLQVECDLDLPGFTQQSYPIIDVKTLFSELKVSRNQILHYFLECFHGFYNVEFILNTCAENNNYQAMSKICCLNFQFYEAFFYGLKSLLMYVRENYYFNSFKDSYGQSKNRIIPKNVTKTIESNDDENVNMKKTVVFEFMEDVIMEAVYMLENFYKMILKFTPEKMGSFLQKSVSVWIMWELPLQPLECFFSKNWEQVAYPLAVFLFCDHYKSLTASNDQEPKNSSQIGNTSWQDNKRYISTYLQTKKYSLSSKTKYPFLSTTESKACYQNLYLCKSDAHLESEDLKYTLSSTEMLQNLSVQFTLKLCNVIIDSMSVKQNSEYEEFIRLLHEVVFAPSVLKSDNRNPDEIFSTVLSTLQRNHAVKKKFIHISYDELQEQTISNKFIVFSCGHYFISQSVFEKEVNSIVRLLDNLRLVSTSELVNRLFSDTCYTTCCPNCLFRYVEYESLLKDVECV